MNQRQGTTPLKAASGRCWASCSWPCHCVRRWSPCRRCCSGSPRTSRSPNSPPGCWPCWPHRLRGLRAAHPAADPCLGPGAHLGGLGAAGHRRTGDPPLGFGRVPLPGAVDRRAGRLRHGQRGAAAAGEEVLPGPHRRGHQRVCDPAGRGHLGGPAVLGPAGQRLHLAAVHRLVGAALRRGAAALAAAADRRPQGGAPGHARAAGRRQCTGAEAEPLEVQGGLGAGDLPGRQLRPDLRLLHLAAALPDRDGPERGHLRFDAGAVCDPGPAGQPAGAVVGAAAEAPDRGGGRVHRLLDRRHLVSTCPRRTTPPCGWRWPAWARARLRSHC